MFPKYDIPLGEEKAEEERIDASKAERELGLNITPLKETVQVGRRLSCQAAKVMT